MTHIMIDLETWGNVPGCAIRSIGACTFSPLTGARLSEFLINITDESCEEAGLHKDPDTEEWWSKQSLEAREAFKVYPRSLEIALSEFNTWLNLVGGIPRDMRLWCHGADFDEPILRTAYRMVGLKPAYPPFITRCTRTLFGVADVRPDRTVGTHHNALDDCRAQALAVAQAFRKLGRIKC